MSAAPRTEVEWQAVPDAARTQRLLRILFGPDDDDPEGQHHEHPAADQR
jgi:hypothetical protein